MSLSERVDAAIEAALGGRIVGCVVLVHRDGKPIYARAAGFADREAETLVAEDTIFRMASCTKPIVACAALRMLDLGLLSLDDPVTKYLPLFTPKAPDGSTPVITLRHLLTHTSGLSYESMPDNVSRGSDARELMPLTENLRRLARGPLVFAPGTGWAYGMSIDVLGGVLAAINRSDLATVVDKYICGPLGMTDTKFRVTDLARLAYPYGDGEPAPYRMAEPQPIEENGEIRYMSPRRILQREAPQSGGSGMAGTAGDLMRLLDALLVGDLLHPQTRDAALSNQIGTLPRAAAGQRFGFIGAIIDDAAVSGWPFTGMLQWGGVWGNNWILEPASRTAVVVYTNTMREGCNGPFRAEIRDAVFV